MVVMKKKLVLYRAPDDGRGNKVEQILKENNIDYEVSYRNSVIFFTMPRLETPYGTYEGEEEIQNFVKERISKNFRK